MAINVKEKLGADWAIAISGIAGPNGGSQDKPVGLVYICLLYTSPSPRDVRSSRMPSSA